VYEWWDDLTDTQKQECGLFLGFDNVHEPKFWEKTYAFTLEFYFTVSELKNEN